VNTKKREVTFDHFSAKESEFLIEALLKSEQAISRGETGNKTGQGKIKR
jgi:hypothetical protein